MAKKRKAQKPLPRMVFSHGGAKLTKRDLASVVHDLELPEEYQRLLLWRNGGDPESPYFAWTHPKRKKKQWGRVTRFFGYSPESLSDRGRDNDCVWAILKFRHWLPRWSIPIGFVNDDDFLLTFCNYDERAGQVWIKFWSHDAPDDDKGPEKDLFFVADSISAFVHSLQK